MEQAGQLERPLHLLLPLRPSDRAAGRIAAAGHWSPVVRPTPGSAASAAAEASGPVRRPGRRKDLRSRCWGVLCWAGGVRAGGSVSPPMDWASCMICAMASGFDRMLLSLSSNSAMAGPAFPYFCIALLMRSTSAAPSGLCIIRLTMAVSWAVSPLAADLGRLLEPCAPVSLGQHPDQRLTVLGLHQGAEGGGIAFELFRQPGPSCRS